MKKNLLVFGATSAIAMAVLEEYLKEEVHLHLIARNPEKLQAIINDWRIRYPHATLSCQVADLADTKQHPHLLQSALKDMPRIDIAFLCHGYLADQAQCEQSYAAT